MKSPTKNSLAQRVAPKAISNTRRDIADWRRAVYLATTQEQRTWPLQDILADIANDALLTAQVNNRARRIEAAQFELVKPDGVGSGKVNDALTEQLRAAAIMPPIISAAAEAELYGYSLVELAPPSGATLLPRRNVCPEAGLFYPDTSYQAGAIAYRQLPEYGRFLLEFRAADSLGLLNKAVPHVLFKKFAQSCWSELCEIYGIPPRYIKTNTQDEAMLNRAEAMMRDMGAAAWFIIDTTEEFAFAQGASTNGDVYRNLIALCNSEISLLISGAIIGQDTEHGNYAKEDAAQRMLAELVEADKRRIEADINNTVLPALAAIGILPAQALSLRFRFAATEDVDKLWTFVKDLLPQKEIDDKWILEKFGIPTAPKNPAPAPLTALTAQADPYFFG